MMGDLPRDKEQSLANLKLIGVLLAQNIEMVAEHSWCLATVSPSSNTVSICSVSGIISSTYAGRSHTSLISDRRLNYQYPGGEVKIYPTSFDVDRFTMRAILEASHMVLIASRSLQKECRHLYERERALLRHLAQIRKH
jgi:hypothetical protein